jgi:outer membrane protein TolC
MNKSSLALAAILVGAGLSSCAVGPDYEAPETAVPDAWHRELTDTLASGEAQIDAWWEVLNDPVLDSERSLFGLQDEHADSEGLVVQNLIRPYKALGGGWNPATEPNDDGPVEDGRP